MVQIIVGNKGKGKTKVLIDKVNKDVKEAKGNIVYLDKSNKHMYELSNKIRLINVKDYLISNYNEFIGFICGILSQDHDLERIYADSFIRVANVNEDTIETAIDKLKDLSEKFQVDFVISISVDKERLPESAKEDVIMAL